MFSHYIINNGMERNVAGELADRLKERVIDVCRYYIPGGVFAGNYYKIGNVNGAAGGSMWVRLRDQGAKRGGRWRDESTGEGGDLVDLIMFNRGLNKSGAIAEARHFLNDVPALPALPEHQRGGGGKGTSRADAGEKLFKRCKPLKGTHGAAYLAARGLAGIEPASVRFHPSLFVYVNPGDQESQQFPGLVGSVTDPNFQIVGAQRIFLDPHKPEKANIYEPKRGMGALEGNAVRMGIPGLVAVAGEGLETCLSAAGVLPPGTFVNACGASNHMAQFVIPSMVRFLVILEDDDEAGALNSGRLAERANAAGVRAARLKSPSGKDFNNAVMDIGRDELARYFRAQLAAAKIPVFAD